MIKYVNKIRGDNTWVIETSEHAQISFEILPNFKFYETILFNHLPVNI